MLGDLIDLAQDNSVQWPVPRAGRSSRRAPPRRHYLRVSAEPHPGLARRIDSLVRRAGLTVQNRARARRAARHAPRLRDLAERRRADRRRRRRSSRELGRVEQTLWLGVARVTRARGSSMPTPRLPGRAPAARADERRDARAARRARRAHAQTASRGCTPSAARSSATCSARRNVVAWQEAKARVPVRAATARGPSCRTSTRATARRAPAS